MLFLNMKKVILGATGSIGSSLAKKLVEWRTSSFGRKR
jgi:FlaA1/EpsC-like NDP-sugar epimerase